MSFHPHSFADTAGRVFRWKGNLYRGITSERAAFFSELLRGGVIQDLSDMGLLIDTELTGSEVSGFEAVVRHREIPFASYPNEWCVAMFKDGALTILDLLIELTRRGLTLKDGHPWNLLFDGCKPVYVDLTSIQPLEECESWPAYDEFCRFCFYPLILMCHGRERVARCLVSEYEGVLRPDLRTLPNSFAFSSFALSKLLRRGLGRARFLRKRVERRAAQLSFLERLRRDVGQLRPPSYNAARQGAGGGAHARQSGDTFAAAVPALHEILDRLRPETLLEICNGEGSYSAQAARGGRRVVYIDEDPCRVTSLYDEARRRNLPVLPLIMDFIKPTPSVGYSSHYSVAATERLRCDMVMALSLVHRLVFDRHLNFGIIAEGLSLFSKRWLVVDFVPGQHSDASRHPWYTLVNLREALGKHFSSIVVKPLGQEGSALLVCEKESI